MQCSPKQLEKEAHRYGSSIIKIFFKSCIFFIQNRKWMAKMAKCLEQYVREIIFAKDQIFKMLISPKSPTL